MSSFDRDSYETAYPVHVEHHFWSLARCDVIARAIAGTNLKDAPWLEVGCGSGVVVAALRQRGLHVDGCEIAAVPPHLVHVPDLRLATDVFDLPREERARYRGLLLLDVLEHLPERQAFLDRLFEAFPNAERLIITVPARAELWSNYDTHYGHHLRYSLAGMAEEVQSSPWKLRAARYFFHALYLPMFLASRLKGGRLTSVAGPSTGTRRAIHRALAAFCRLEDRVIPGGVPGTSVLAVLERPAGAADATRARAS